MALGVQTSLQPGATYTFTFDGSGTIAGFIGQPPSNAEVASAVNAGVYAVDNVSATGGAGLFGQLFGGGWNFQISFQYIGDGTDTVGTLAQQIAQALDSAFSSTAYTFAQAELGLPSTSSPGGLSASTWILIGIAAALILGVLAWALL